MWACMQLLQELVELHKQYHDKGLEIMAWQVLR
jgi:glutathione peroxidase-family protein